MSLRFYDTRARRKLPFEPSQPGKVGLYACGITVYDICHVGHARMMVAFDVIARHLRSGGLDVKFVRNVTDVDDKIIRRAATEGRTALEVARHFEQEMATDMRALGVTPPEVEPRATEHIAEMIDVIKRLESKSLAYAVAGDVYYAVGGFPSYGQLSGQNTDDLKVGARIEVGENKRSPLDFTLWKGAKPGEPFWDSPWGPGRPGWHIECSAMAHRYLGEGFDLHGGGTDLIFPHHENEIAQSEGAFGAGHFARHWLHSGMVNFGGEKMSKSLGNVVTIRGVAESHDLEALRLLLVSVHYRSPVSFEIARDAAGKPNYPDLDQAESRLEYFYRTLERIDQAGIPAGETGDGDVLPPADRTSAAFAEAMDDDFNTAAAVGLLYESFVLANKLLDEPKAASKDVRRRTLARLRRELRACGATLGIFQRPADEFLLARRARLCVRRNIDGAAVEARIAERTTARASKDFTRADEIR
ncbi:MAG TPA: cysteine--tRNA ligase, partial [Polyangia bacterium]|nr:cysteine--tRNA ligase [Polyangia bacterium]